MWVLPWGLLLQVMNDLQWWIYILIVVWRNCSIFQKQKRNCIKLIKNKLESTSDLQKMCELLNLSVWKLVAKKEKAHISSGEEKALKTCICTCTNDYSLACSSSMDIHFIIFIFWQICMIVQILDRGMQDS